MFVVVVSGQRKARMHLPSNRLHFTIRTVLPLIYCLSKLVESLLVPPALTLHVPMISPRSHHALLLALFLLLQLQRIKPGDWDKQSQQDTPDQRRRANRCTVGTLLPSQRHYSHVPSAELHYEQLSSQSREPDGPEAPIVAKVGEDLAKV